MIITGPRGCGKTTALIAHSIEHEIPILCHSKMQRDFLRTRAAEYINKNRLTRCSFPEPLLYGIDCQIFPNQDVLIDDVEYFLKTILRCDVVGFTTDQNTLSTIIPDDHI